MKYHIFINMNLENGIKSYLVTDFTKRLLGVGGTKAPFVNFSVSEMSDLAKCLLYSLNHIHIRQVSPQLSCGATCQI